MHNKEINWTCLLVRLNSLVRCKSALINHSSCNCWFCGWNHLKLKEFTTALCSVLHVMYAEPPSEDYYTVVPFVTLWFWLLHSGAVCYTMVLYCCTVVPFVTLWLCCCTCAVCNTCPHGAMSEQTECVMTLTCPRKLQTKVQTGSYWIHPPASWRLEGSRRVTRPLISWWLCQLGHVKRALHYMVQSKTHENVWNTNYHH